jgi:hypothetical protein
MAEPTEVYQIYLPRRRRVGRDFINEEVTIEMLHDLVEQANRQFARIAEELAGKADA